MTRRHGADAGLVTRVLPGADVTAPADVIDVLGAIVTEHGTWYDWAADQPQPRVLQGRAPVYVAIPPGTSVALAIRHAWHGGLLAPLTGDRFMRPTRAPHEAAMSARLRAAGIPTTEVVGYARYDAGLGFCRVDVASVYLADAVDLGMVAAGLAPGIACGDALAATQVLLQQLAAAGVSHPDLNVKNILLTRGSDAQLTAHVIDVDVVRWSGPEARAAVMQANAARLARSIRKWRVQFGCEITDTMLTAFLAQATAAGGLA